MLSKPYAGDGWYHSDLRRRAEELLLKEHGEFGNISPVDMRNVVHELRVHQIELEMQNEELRRTQQELQASRESILTFIIWPLRDMSPSMKKE